MKRTKWLVMAAVMALPLLCARAQAPVGLSPGASEIVKLAESGTSDEVMLSYVQNVGTPFNLTADQIVYLKDVGLSQQVLSAMINRDGALRGQALPPIATGPSEPPPAAAPPVEPPPPAPAEAPLVPPNTEYVSTPPPDVNYFYNDLSPYGAWVDLPGYGWCWQPTVVVINHGWRPYCDSGHWIYSDCGWYWASDYSWGWAPFHYGRWFLAGCGWVWCPDRVWGPSWVCWRSHGDYCGWAPLPPHAVFEVGVGWRFNGVHVGVGFDFGLHADHFVFIGLGDFCAHDLHYRALPATQVTRIYNNTTIINNYTVVNNKTIINNGIKVERVQAATHTPIQKVVVRDLPAGANASARVHSSGKELAVYRQPLKAPTTPVKMVAQKVDAQRPVIHHTELATAPVRNERTLGTHGTATAGSTPRSYQTEPSRSAPHSAPEKTTPPRTDNTAPHSRQSTAVEAPLVPKAHTVEQANGSHNTEASSSRSTSHSAPAREATAPSTPNSASRSWYDEPKPATRSMPGYHPEVQTPTYPLRSSGQNYSGSGQENNSHSYYPKSYHQASEAHSLPPVNGPSSKDSSSGSGHSSSGRDSSSPNSGHGSDSRSGK
ncbi:MAG: hypothetical protein C5B50_21395 [Verrucomicrobia bacterium]|nr:MAG: hypothetical protein C5B50_21395 [Verrucomicrobiota bacterium]